MIDYSTLYSEFFMPTFRERDVVYEKIESLTNLWPHHVRLISFGLEEKREIVAWCYDTYGTKGPRWTHLTTQFSFRDEKDAMFFLMRWS